MHFFSYFSSVGLIEQKYEKKLHSLVKKLKINVKMQGEHNVKKKVSLSDRQKLFLFVFTLTSCVGYMGVADEGEADSRGGR